MIKSITKQAKKRREEKRLPPDQISAPRSQLTEGRDKGRTLPDHCSEINKIGQLRLRRKGGKEKKGRVQALPQTDAT